MAQAIELKQIPLSELQVGRWYVGRGRNANIGLWNGEVFLVIGLCGHPVSWEPRKWVNEPCIKHESYLSAESGCFQPFKLIDEGGASEPIELEYTKTLTFNSPDL